MKKALFVAATLTCSVGLAAPPTSTPELGIRSRSTPARAFTGATIVVSPDKRIETGTLIVENGLIVSVRRGRVVPEGASEVDVSGHVIFPGFVEPFSEYGLGHVKDLNPARQERGPKYEADRIGGQAWNDAIHAERRWADEFKPDKSAAEALWKRGVTAVHSAKRDGIFRGRGFIASLAQGLANDAVIDAEGLHVLSFDKGSSKQSYPTSLMGSIALIRQTFYDARWHRQAQQAYALNPAQPAPEFNRALESVSRDEHTFIFETRDDLTLLRASRIASEFSLPFIYIGSQLEYESLDEIAALGRPLVLPASLPGKPSVETIEDRLDVSLADLRHWERAPTNAAQLERRGVVFALTGQGLGTKEKFLDNVRRMVEAGLSRRAALAALTTVPADLIGIADEAGSLHRGKRADFSIWNADPLESEKAAVAQIWIRGEKAHEFTDPAPFAFAGSYETSLTGRDVLLEIRGDDGKLKGSLKAGDDEITLQGMTKDGNRLTFRAPLDEFEIEGTALFSLVGFGETVRGYVQLPDGRTSPRALTPTAANPEQEEKGDAKQVSEEQDLLSLVTYPNVGFGRASPPEPEHVLIKNATIWTLEDQGTLLNADLIVKDGRIEKIGANLTAPRRARVIDATGKHVTPGIIDEHSHLAISRGVNEGSHAITAEVRIGDVVNPSDVGIYRALAGGVTSAQLLHGSANPIGGQAQVIKMRWGRPAEELKFAAAPPSIKFALGENVKQSNWGNNARTRYPQTRMGVESLMRDAFVAAREYQREWNEYRALGVSERERTVPPRRDLQLDTLLEILESQRFVHCHSYVQSEILMLMRLAEEFEFTIQTFTHILEGFKVAPEMARHGAGGSTFSDWWAYKFEVYDAIPYNPCLMHKHGVVTSINSDSSDVIRRLNQEAGKSVMYCGMPEDEALKLATLNPARQLRIDDRVGSLAVGKDADLVIWNGHPLSMSSLAEKTWVDGALYFDRDEDLAMRERLADEKRNLIQKALAQDKKKKGDGKGRDARKKEPEWHCDDTEVTHD